MVCFVKPKQKKKDYLSTGPEDAVAADGTALEQMSSIGRVTLCLHH